jgi:hypothetical protein
MLCYKRLVRFFKKIIFILAEKLTLKLKFAFHNDTMRLRISLLKNRNFINIYLLMFMIYSFVYSGYIGVNFWGRYKRVQKTSKYISDFFYQNTVQWNFRIFGLNRIEYFCVIFNEVWSELNKIHNLSHHLNTSYSVHFEVRFDRTEILTKKHKNNQIDSANVQNSEVWLY